jgi:hypothetical protein
LLESLIYRLWLFQVLLLRHFEYRESRPLW